MAHVPILEPSDAQEAYEQTQFAFDPSERFDTPVILRLTTRSAMSIIEAGTDPGSAS